MSSQSDGVVTLDDLSAHFRVDVQRGWVGLEMKPTWTAQLLDQTSHGRWRAVGKQVVNDEGPVQAISDLLSILDIGKLAR